MPLLPALYLSQANLRGVALGQVAPDGSGSGASAADPFLRERSMSSTGGTPRLPRALPPLGATRSTAQTAAAQTATAQAAAAQAQAAAPTIGQVVPAPYHGPPDEVAQTTTGVDVTGGVFLCHNSTGSTSRGSGVHAITAPGICVVTSSPPRPPPSPNTSTSMDANANANTSTTPTVATAAAAAATAAAQAQAQSQPQAAGLETRPTAVVGATGVAENEQQAGNPSMRARDQAPTSAAMAAATAAAAAAAELAGVEAEEASAAPIAVDDSAPPADAPLSAYYGIPAISSVVAETLGGARGIGAAAAAKAVPAPTYAPGTPPTVEVDDDAENSPAQAAPIDVGTPPTTTYPQYLQQHLLLPSPSSSVQQTHIQQPQGHQSQHRVQQVQQMRMRQSTQAVGVSGNGAAYPRPRQPMVPAPYEMPASREQAAAAVAAITARQEGLSSQSPVSQVPLK